MTPSLLNDVITAITLRVEGTTARDKKFGGSSVAFAAGTAGLAKLAAGVNLAGVAFAGFQGNSGVADAALHQVAKAPIALSKILSGFEHAVALMVRSRDANTWEPYPPATGYERGGIRILRKEESDS